jgi:small subunit ribosomal protein S8e
MARSQEKSLRKASGGRLRSARTKRRFELAGFPANTKIADQTVLRQKRVLGGHHKSYLLTTKVINVSDQKGKTQKAEIITVLENPANPHLVRRNILTKGAVVNTKLGKVKITSRPGQDGIVNGILLK